MKASALTLANLIVASLLLLTPFLVGLTASAPYDPWYDLDENGEIDIFDVVRIAGTYGTSGDSSKNVNVTNWPTSEATTVLWEHYLENYQYIESAHYNASGFGHLHISVNCIGLSGAEYAIVFVYGVIKNEADPLDYHYSMAHTTTLEEPTLIGGENTASVTIPVPAEQFAFGVLCGETTSCYVCLSFYLTWA